MLSERQLEALLKVFEARTQTVTEEYLTRMGEHLKAIGQLSATDVHRLIELKRMNANIEAIKLEIARIAEVMIEDVETVFREAAAADERFARAIFEEDHTPTVKYSPIAAISSPVERVLKAQLRITQQTMANLSQTTIDSTLYREAVDKAVQLVQTGMTGYQSAIRSAMKQAAGDGLKVIYPSGYSRRLDTAVRQNVLDGVRALNQDVMDQVGKEYRADGVEVSAHALCAKDHLPYQGRQYSLKEFERIQNNLERPFGMWNCKHTMFPILLGISPPAHSEEELAQYAMNSNAEITIDGVTMSRYEWTQQQRRIETRVRAQKDIAVAAKAEGDMTARREAQKNINALQAQYEKISNEAGLIRKPERMSVAGFRQVKASIAPQSTDAAVELIDFSAAYNFAKGDSRLTGMLRSGDAQSIGTAVNEIIGNYGLRDSKWSGKILVKSKKDMGAAVGIKEWTCDISIRSDSTHRLKTYIHENLHSRSVSYFPPEIFPYHKAMEEASVELLAQAICKESSMPFSKSYTKYVSALSDIRTILFPDVDEYTFAKDIFDIDMDKRYTYIANQANRLRIDNPNMDNSIRTRMNDALKVLAGRE